MVTNVNQNPMFSPLFLLHKQRGGYTLNFPWLDLLSAYSRLRCVVCCILGAINVVAQENIHRNY